MSAIRTEGLTKYYGKVHALDGLSLSVETGKIFGFLGPNGAGKSTSIRLLTGLAHPPSGHAWVGEIEFKTGQKSASQKISSKIGYLAEEPALYPWMTPAELLDYIGRLFGLSPLERNQQTRELLKLTGLDQVSKRHIAGFSRGMRQRLGLAQSLVNKPEILFLDEPVSALDPAGRKEILEMINGLRGECTVFMSTHILADVERVCDTVGIINHGKMVISAAKDDLIRQYTIPAFVAECIEGDENKLNELCKNLRTLRWVKSVTIDGSIAHIVVNDVPKAQQELLLHLIQAGLTLQRYEMVAPTLEDVFLQLVGEEGKIS
jgi:ABC-2 type transport system ATP-binding protein